MKSPTGLLLIGLSVALSVAVTVGGPQGRALAEQAKVAAGPAQASQEAPAKAVAVQEPSAKPTQPAAKGPPTPAQPRGVVPPAVLPGAAAPARAAVASPPTTATSAGGSGAPAAVPQMRPSPMPRGPSMYETGRVGKMGVDESGVEIGRTESAARPKEQRVEGATRAADRPPAGPGGVLDQATLARELRPRLALLNGCRVEVARHKRVPASSVRASKVILRWTVATNGQVSDTEVVALSPIDGQVTDCVKREMSIWSFSPPTGGPALVERPFRFR